MTEIAPEIQPQTTEPKSTQIDCEVLTDQVWHDLRESVPRASIAQTVERLLAKYRDGAIQTFVPILVRREARDLLRSANLTEIEADFNVTELGC